MVTVYGRRLGTEPEQFAKSKYIIAWGANIHGNNIHLWPFIEEARRKGAKLVVIDPYKTRTAKAADWYLPINPGTDVALALGMMHVIINEKLYDAEYVSEHTLGFDQLKQRAQEYPPEKVAQWTGISADDIRTLAREYATSHPAVIRVNYGVQRSQNGGMAVRTIAMLPCLIGAWKEEGGGLQLSLSASFPMDRRGLERPELMEKSPLGRPAACSQHVRARQSSEHAGRSSGKSGVRLQLKSGGCGPQSWRRGSWLSCGPIFSPWCTNNFLLTPSTTPTYFCQPPRSLNTRTCWDRTATRMHRSLTRRLNPLGECKSNHQLFQTARQNHGLHRRMLQPI